MNEVIFMGIKIFIDQGHNPSGHNLGAQGHGLLEQDVNYAVGMYLADIVSNDPRFDVRTSRNYPSQVLGWDNSSSLQVRVNAANTWPADYFLSIHCNANTNPAINGTEMYVYSLYGEPFPLAQHLLGAIVARVGTRDNLVRVNPGLYVLRRTRMPAVLLELGYLSNAGDAELLRTRQYDFAYAIYEGLLKYFNYYPL